MKVTPQILREIRSKRSSRTADEAYAEMEAAAEISEKASKLVGPKILKQILSDQPRVTADEAYAQKKEAEEVSLHTSELISNGKQLEHILVTKELNE